MTITWRHHGAAALMTRGLFCIRDNDNLDIQGAHFSVRAVRIRCQMPTFHSISQYLICSTRAADWWLSADFLPLEAAFFENSVHGAWCACMVPAEIRMVPGAHVWVRCQRIHSPIFALPIVYREFLHLILLATRDIVIAN